MPPSLPPPFFWAACNESGLGICRSTPGQVSDRYRYRRDSVGFERRARMQGSVPGDTPIGLVTVRTGVRRVVTYTICWRNVITG